MMENVIVAVFSGVFCTLIAALVSLIMTPRILRAVTKEAIDQHVAVWHKDTICDYVEKELNKHVLQCTANQNFEQVRIAVFWLVENAGGDIRSLFPVKKGN